MLNVSDKQRLNVSLRKQKTQKYGISMLIDSLTSRSYSALFKGQFSRTLAIRDTRLERKGGGGVKGQEGGGSGR